ncbi:rhodanese-like domain-containing protein [Caldichromatium japonicum]|uniref:Rhodanese-like domain-containing protein n=1 Tax=Caldichromatium japonicum TaxID=2699430 RepID=A0A6G7VEJ1_9GAMM|nr:rhodanese-like domain-containing protein [Caldichromatium japonicum]QIK38459.1 rhodanese-like domain-containing protein [Caldichromatium japonicum]
MSLPAFTPSAVLLAGVLATLSVHASEPNRITPTLYSVQVKHQSQIVTIRRGNNPYAVLAEPYQKTDRGCPPFCVQPMIVADGVETIGELEVLDYLKRMSEGDDSILVVDSRTPDWVLRGTIPGSVNIPWNRLSRDSGGTFETPQERDAFEQILRDQFGVKRDGSGQWDFSRAKTLVLFCNGIWCPQSTMNIKTLLGIGYPRHKLKWYRGGMQDWLSVGLTSVQP